MKQYCDWTAEAIKPRTSLFDFAEIQLFHLFNDDQIIPGQQKTVARNIESWPGVSSLVASVAGEVLWEAAHTRPLLDGGEEEHGEEIPDPGVDTQPQPGQQRRVLPQHLALTREVGWFFDRKRNSGKINPKMECIKLFLRGKLFKEKRITKRIPCKWLN